MKGKLKEAGIDFDDGVERFMGNEALYIKFLKRFCDDMSYPQLKEAINMSDCSGAFNAAHTLKGVCGNLSLKVLEKPVKEQVEFLRRGDLNSAVQMMDEITASYEIVISAIKEL